MTFRVAQAIAAAGVLFSLIATTHPATADPLSLLHTSGVRIVDAGGHRVTLRGVNIGGWMMLEAWMTPADSSGLPDNYTMIQTLDKRFGVAEEQNLLKTYEKTWITTQDLDNIQAQGLNFIRVPIWWPNFYTLDGKWRPDAFEMLDWIVDEASKRGIYTLIDMHGVFGGESKAQSSGQEDDAYWTNAHDQDATDAMWAKIAEHYKDNPAVMGYDLINEPMNPPATVDVYKAYDRLYKVIRGVDPTHIIVMDSTFGQYSLESMPDPDTRTWTNIIYEIHEYQFAGDQATVEKGAMNRVLNINAHRLWPMPAYIGEFNGFGSGSTGADTWQYILSLYNDDAVNWTMWSYKSTHGNATDDSWGLYTPKNPRPPVPNLQKDDPATIAADWKQWSTANAFTLNPMLGPLLRGGESPFRGIAQSIPGTIPFDTYDNGGPGLGYNSGGATQNAGGVFRTDGIGIETCADTAGHGDGRDVGWTGDGYWMRYTVDVAKAGVYDVDIRASSGVGGGIVHLESTTGADLSAPIKIPNTEGWQNWTDVHAKVNLAAGPQTLEFYEDTGGENLESMTFTPLPS